MQLKEYQQRTLAEGEGEVKLNEILAEGRRSGQGMRSPAFMWSGNSVIGKGPYPPSFMGQT